MPQDEIVYFDTPRSATLFDDAQTKSHFWTICRYFVSERFMTYCGVATGVTLLNSLSVPAPDVPQVYPYKMFTQDNLFTDEVLKIRRPHDIEQNGNTLDQLAEILQTFEVRVEALHADQLNLESFRSLAIDVLESADRRLAVDFDRGVLGQKGSGHFSPLAAYHSGEDRLLLMDVARYKLPSCWVTTRDLWNAINTIDSVSNRTRGLLVITRKENKTAETT